MKECETEGSYIQPCSSLNSFTLFPFFVAFPGQFIVPPLVRMAETQTRALSETALLSAPSSSSSFPSTRRLSHYQTFSQLNSPPKEKAKEKRNLLHRRSFLPDQKFQVTMGFISKKGKEKEKEEKINKSKGKGKEKESSLPLSSSSLKPKKKHSVARLLMLAASEPPPTVILPPSPSHSGLREYALDSVAPSPFDEKPGPFAAPVILNDHDHDDRELSYSEREASGSVFRLKARLAKDRGMKVQPYGEQAVYPKSYDHMSLEKCAFSVVDPRIN